MSVDIKQQQIKELVAISSNFLQEVGGSLLNKQNPLRVMKVFLLMIPKVYQSKPSNELMAFLSR